MSQYLDKVFLYLFIYCNNGQNVLFIKPYKIEPLANSTTQALAFQFSMTSG